ncbi:hypothetical protein OH77DRAFT_1458850 [Trametes cingulata]|nr:hypothetical protein OH77DRAFT_1458850 [Trametes cingulata]
MLPDEPSFLFSSLGSAHPTTARKLHIRRLFDVLHLSLQRQDWHRAKRAWAILARCKEVQWKTLWRTSLLLLSEGDELDEDQVSSDSERVGFLTIMMRQYPEERESILRELVLRLIRSGMYTRAMEELDLYLPSYPYQDNPVLHVYAGLIALYLAQPDDMPEQTTHGWNASYLRDAQAHFERARLIDPSNVVAETFLSQVNRRLRQWCIVTPERIADSQQQLSGATHSERDHVAPDSDDEKMEVDETSQARKRVKA